MRNYFCHFDRCHTKFRLRILGRRSELQIGYTSCESVGMAVENQFSLAGTFTARVYALRSIVFGSFGWCGFSWVFRSEYNIPADL